MKNRLFLFLLIGIFSSCASHQDNLQAFLNKQLRKHYTSIVSDYRYIAIIPRKGCHACTMQADAFFKEHRKDERCLFVFTNLVSEKLLKIEVGYENFSGKNILIDRENHLYNPEYTDSEYPLLLIRKENGQYQCCFLLDSDVFE